MGCDNFDGDEDAYYLGGSEPIISGRPMNWYHAMYLETINVANESISQRPASNQIVGDLTEDGKESSIASDGDLTDTAEGSHQLVAYMAKRARSISELMTVNTHVRKTLIQINPVNPYQ